jgi:hypothetical protein
MVFAQDKDDKQSAAAQEEQGNDLVGVCEEFDVPAEND